MEIIESIEVMKNRSSQIRKDSQSIGFVPTMGCLHQGHLSLVKRSIKSCEFTVVSIFINPTQFGENEDLETYPQTLEADRKQLQNLGADVLFFPKREMIYPEGFKSFTTVEEITHQLCGNSRPTFFRGLTTIVLKLFNIVQPHQAFFGEKDRQQLEVIRILARDLNLDVKIVGLPIVRERDGLAMSSRNLYLSDKERQSARSLYRALKKAKVMVEKGERSTQKIKQEMQKIILKEPHTQIDYISFCDLGTFADRDSINGTTLIALAVHVGKARLIDNCIVETVGCKK